MAMTKSGIRLARRLDEVGFSDIVQIRNKVMAMRSEGLKVHSLHGGEPYFETPEGIKFAAVRALVENQTHYAPSSGLPALRKALVGKLAVKNRIQVTTEEVIVTVGGSQGLYGGFQSVLDPGDARIDHIGCSTPRRIDGGGILPAVEIADAQPVEQIF